jgi:phosphomannomutase/phosphoglucomutase
MVTGTVKLNPGIFKAYDIRGVLGTTLDKGIAYQIGQAFGSAAVEGGEQTVVIGRDGRLSGPDLSAALAEGLQSTGIDVIDIGMVATPMLYFATHTLGASSGIMVTGSHNPPDYNGFKMVLAGAAIYGDTITALYQRLQEGRLAQGRGGYREHSIRDAYLQRIVSDIKLERPMHIAVDCGNGVAGAVAGDLYRQLGCTVTELFCEVDGNFPNHHPDPAHPENLQDLIRTLANSDAEIGLAFDGDGDRLGVVTKTGEIIYPDRQLMLFAQEILGRHPGAHILFDVKCSRHVAEVVKASGGHPLMCRTGHSLVKAKMKETGAPFGGEMSGHLFFKDRWYGFDDGLYAGARLLELASQVSDPGAMLNALPQSMSTPELQISLPEGENHVVVAQLQRDAQWPGARDVITLDGVRVEYPDGFGLVRASNTTPVLVLRFEAEDAGALHRIQQSLGAAIRAVRPDAALPF